METIGETLKKRRIEREMNLADAHEATKITMQNLAALEEDRFDAFPNRVYARAFLRDYANFLGLDSEELLQRYEAEWATTEAPKPVRRSRAVPVGLIVLFVLLGAAGGVGYFSITQGWPIKLESRKPTPKRQITKPSPAPVVPPANQPTTPETNEPVKPTTGQTPETPENTEPPKPPDTVRVELQAVDHPVWIKVKVNGEKEFEGTLAPSDKAAFGGKTVWIRAGYSGSLQVTVDGKDLGRLGAPGQVAEKTFKAQPPVSSE